MLLLSSKMYHAIIGVRKATRWKFVSSPLTQSGGRARVAAQIWKPSESAPSGLLETATTRELKD